MAVLALLFLVVGLPYTLFNVGGITPASGSGTPMDLAEQPNRAALALKSVRPTIVYGLGFKANERVRISGAGTKTIRATARGTFSTRIGRDACQGFTVVAVGSGGSRATLNFAQISSVHCLDR